MKLTVWRAKLSDEVFERNASKTLTNCGKKKLSNGIISNSFIENHSGITIYSKATLSVSSSFHNRNSFLTYILPHVSIL
jgi:hypothetical protein